MEISRNFLFDFYFLFEKEIHKEKSNILANIFRMNMLYMMILKREFQTLYS